MNQHFIAKIADSCSKIMSGWLGGATQSLQPAGVDHVCYAVPGGGGGGGGAAGGGPGSSRSLILWGPELPNSHLE